jgi:hypothetical protein
MNDMRIMHKFLIVKPKRNNLPYRGGYYMCLNTSEVLWVFIHTHYVLREKSAFFLQTVQISYNYLSSQALRVYRYEVLASL